MRLTTSGQAGAASGAEKSARSSGGLTARVAMKVGMYIEIGSQSFQ